MSDIVDRIRIAETAPLDADGKVSLFLVLQDARAEITRLREERRWITEEERWAVEQAKAAYEQSDDDDVCERIVRGLESLLARKGGEVK